MTSHIDEGLPEVLMKFCKHSFMAVLGSRTPTTERYRCRRCNHEILVIQQSFNDPESFEGMNKFPITSNGYVECPKCKGYGGWNLRTNAYGPGKHFDASCINCMGSGSVPYNDSECVHNYIYVGEVGRCLHCYKCSKCGKVMEVDSSD